MRIDTETFRIGVEEETFLCQKKKSSYFAAYLQQKKIQFFVESESEPKQQTKRCFECVNANNSAEEFCQL